MNPAPSPVQGGVMAAVLTPMTATLEVDTGLWLDHCRWLLAEGLDGLAVLGTTGEANSLSLSERLAMLAALADGGIPMARVVPGTGCCALPETVALTRAALEAGAGGVLVLPPFYYKPVTEDGLYAAYSEVIQRVGESRLKLLLYHIPQYTGVPIPFALIERLLAAYPDTVVGIKDSSGDFANMVRTCEAFPGFHVFSGSDAFLHPLLEAGGAGSITACNNIAAALSARIYAANGSHEGAALQEQLGRVRAAFQDFPLIEGLKEATARLTGNPQWRNLRPPLTPLSEKDGDALMARLAETGLALER